MTNLRNAENYNIGLDLGTGSVGWAVTDENGELYHFKKKPTWGSRLFSSAETAEKTRTARGQRRRYRRRRKRLDLLQNFFLEEMQKVDPEFFIRLNQSRIHKEDRCEDVRNYRWPLFSDKDFNEKDYYKQFPTIYHLRKDLCESAEQKDIRLIYLAFHNIAKTRGNFLHEDNTSLSAQNANMQVSLKEFKYQFEEWCELNDITIQSCDIEKLQTILEDQNLSKADKTKEAAKYIRVDKEYKKMVKAIINSFVGYTAQFKDIFFLEEADSFSLSNEEKVEEFYDKCPEEGVDLFDSLRNVYMSFVLYSILKKADGKMLSSAKVAQYDKYGQDLKELKNLFKNYAMIPLEDEPIHLDHDESYYDEFWGKSVDERRKDYHAFFNGVHYDDSHWSGMYNPEKAEGYTKYNLRRGNTGEGNKKKSSYENLKKDMVKVFKKLDKDCQEIDEDSLLSEMAGTYRALVAGMEDETFLRRLKTKDNLAIPYQLHLEEMSAIIDKQGQYYPFLIEHKEKIESLVKVRIPYYVGPLSQHNAALDPATGNARFAWSTRLPGKEHEAIRPWNWESIIDKDAAAEAFIDRMKGSCTYIYSEPVLPKCSLLYEEYCVLNEINGAHYSSDGDKHERFDKDFRELIIEKFRKKKGKVTYSDIKDLYKQKKCSIVTPEVRGGQGKSGFESRLQSYHFFKDLLSDEEFDQDPYMFEIVEEVILWSTLFEDRKILKKKIREKYGDVFNEDQIEKIAKKRMKGWGRLSKRFLCEVKAEISSRRMSIIDLLRSGDPGDDKGKNIGRSMILMEILKDERFKFEEKIDSINQENMKDDHSLELEDLQGSPALRRSCNQVLRIVEEIVGIAGKAPQSIYIEVTRTDGEKGKIPKKRAETLRKGLKKVADETLKTGIFDELKKNESNLSEKLVLYFMQNGKCMYCEKEDLDISRLNEYHVDHVIPQCYIKDDSIENKVLVHAGCNESKGGNLLISSDVRIKMKHHWSYLHEAGLIGEKKYNNLLRDEIDDKQLKGFINRQLVETSQIVKQVRLLLKKRYPDTSICSIKASLSSELRKRCDFPKCREANDYHHAHDAYLASELGRFIRLRHPHAFENPIVLQEAMKSYIDRNKEKYKKNSEKYKNRAWLPGSSSCFIGSFLKDGFDKETGEIVLDDWDVSAEINKIETYLNYPQCFISRMPEITSGPFWKQTIYSPRQKKNVDLPLKKNLDVKKYGTFDSENPAFFSIYKAQKGKNKKKVFQLVFVPVYLASEISSKEKIIEFVKKDAEKSKLDFIEIIRPIMFIKQLIEVDNNLFYLNGKKDLSNASQLFFNVDEMRLLRVLKENSSGEKEKKDVEGFTEERILDFYRSLAHKLSLFAPTLSERFELIKHEEEFMGSTISKQWDVVLDVLLNVKGESTFTKGMKDVFGLPERKGRMEFFKSSYITKNQGKFYLIDRSVTGMFEKRESLEL